jgi:hypothetical protein|tara:strand:- start:192 stop:524 length:333 start_codon:yes stop_codon:yes gene_type:complete
MMNYIDGIKESMERFFGQPAFKLVRKEDPATSHEAAQAVDSTKLEQMVYEAIKSHPDGCISDEILKMYPQFPYSSITARYRALLDKGFIEVTGVKRGRFGRNQRIMRAIK